MRNTILNFESDPVNYNEWNASESVSISSRIVSANKLKLHPRTNSKIPCLHNTASKKGHRGTDPKAVSFTSIDFEIGRKKNTRSSTLSPLPVEVKNYKVSRPEKETPRKWTPTESRLFNITTRYDDYNRQHQPKQVAPRFVPITFFRPGTVKHNSQLNSCKLEEVIMSRLKFCIGTNEIRSEHQRLFTACQIQDGDLTSSKLESYFGPEKTTPQQVTLLLEQQCTILPPRAKTTPHFTSRSYRDKKPIEEYRTPNDILTVLTPTPGIIESRRVSSAVIMGRRLDPQTS